LVLPLSLQGSCQLEISAIKGAWNGSSGGKLAGFPTISWDVRPTGSPELDRPPRAIRGSRAQTPKEVEMLGRILGAFAGEKIAGRNRGLSGALVGAAVPAIARRGLGPIALAVAVGWGAKKLIERRRARRSPPA
jgi:hypothetical protein